MQSVRILSLIAAVAALGLGCATRPLPPATALQPDDLKRLGGTWVWSVPFQTPARLGAGPIKVRIADGRMLFETDGAAGSLTLHDDGRRRVLAGEGRDRRGPFPVQLSQRPGDRQPERAGAAGPVFALVVVP